jgi:hypothetical protein
MLPESDAAAAPRQPGLVEQAMKQRDAELEAAVAALRAAADAAVAAVQTALPKSAHRLASRPQRRKEAEARTGAKLPRAPTLAQQLQQIAHQLRVLEAAVLRPMR